MKVYLIRHAIAEERHVFAQSGRPDSERPLTSKGRDRMEKSADSLITSEPSIDIFLQSPLVRSQQTVDVLKARYKKAKVITTDLLSPGHSAAKLFEYLESFHGQNSVALVGHEPDMGQFLSWMLFRQATDHFPMKRGSIAKLDLYQDRRCYLKWFVRPKFF